MCNVGPFDYLTTPFGHRHSRRGSGISGDCELPNQEKSCFLQEDVVLPARRISKSRDTTPAASDSEAAPDTQGSKAEGAAGSKGKVRKAALNPQDTGPAKKRRKRSSSKTPEASSSGQASADSDREVCVTALVFARIQCCRHSFLCISNALLDTS